MTSQTNAQNAARLDVLAVLDGQIQRGYNPFEPDNQAKWYPGLIEARAAVAELIEAAKKVRDYVPTEGCEAECLRDNARLLGEALARVGGAA